MSSDPYSLLALQTARTAFASLLPPGRGAPFHVVARKHLRIQDEDGSVVPFVLRPIQRRYIALKRLAVMQGRKRRFALLKYRRGGFTTVEQGLSYYMASRRRNVKVATMAQDSDAAMEIFTIPKTMYDRDTDAPLMRAPRNRTRIAFPGLNTTFYVVSAEKRAALRGVTLQRFHWSEVAWSRKGHRQYADQREILAAMEQATRRGEVVLETTPNGSELFREIYTEARDGRNDFTAIFVPWFADEYNRVAISAESAEEIEATITDEERDLIERHSLDLEQLAFRRERKRELKHLFPQEYPEDDETCWLAGGVLFFESSAIVRLRDLCPSLPGGWDDASDLYVPGESERVPKGYRATWHPPEPGVEYVIGADTSEGLPGCDANGLIVKRRSDGLDCYAAHGFFNPRELAAEIAHAWEIYNGPLIGVERNNHGHAVLQKLEDLGLGAPHSAGGTLYYHHGAPNTEASISQAGAIASKAGWPTNAITRPIMLDAIRELVETEGAEQVVRDRAFIHELSTFRLQENGKFEADSNAHDDCIFKHAIAHQMRFVDRATGGVRLI